MGFYICLLSYDIVLDMYREMLKIFEKLGDEEGVV